jgi:hypothetical protein
MNKLVMTTFAIIAMSAAIAQAGEDTNFNPDWNFASSDEVIEMVSMRVGLIQDEAASLRIEHGELGW